MLWNGLFVNYTRSYILRTRYFCLDVHFANSPAEHLCNEVGNKWGMNVVFYNFSIVFFEDPEGEIISTYVRVHYREDLFRLFRIIFYIIVR